ncbi:rhomboid protein-like protein [Actinidia rufa]|uniref:Rhomboid protein-like protein n=1 Tax=Actinidia rufa TaxID=165716 RepID=A0A7J0EDJ1_9ERIC|nr:rhomboid protein-like protein [Actinidia rufa]
MVASNVDTYLDYSANRGPGVFNIANLVLKFLPLKNEKTSSDCSFKQKGVFLLGSKLAIDLLDGASLMRAMVSKEAILFRQRLCRVIADILYQWMVKASGQDTIITRYSSWVSLESWPEYRELFSDCQRILRDRFCWASFVMLVAASTLAFHQMLISLSEAYLSHAVSFASKRYAVTRFALAQCIGRDDKVSQVVVIVLISGTLCWCTFLRGTSLFTGFTRLCKGLAVVLVGGHIVVQILPSAVTYLALIPARTIPFAWNLITSGYIEQSVHGAVISTIGLLFIGKLLEPIWGSREFLKFIFCSQLLDFSLCFHYGHFLVLHNNAGKLPWLPSLTLLLAIVLSFFTPEPATYLPTLIFGTYMSWIYLRYLQKKPETKLRGDPSDEFAFSTFFPEFLRPVIDPIASIFGRMLCGRSETLNETRGYTFGGAPLPGSDPIEASRRREKGARALEERLASEMLAVGAREEETKKDAVENV